MPYNDLRKGRYSETGRPYFVTTVTANREPLFNDLFSARQAINEMCRLDRDGQMENLAWILMPDHLHWLFSLNENQTLESVMHLFKGRSAQAINRFLQRRGPVWQRTYYDHALRKEEDIREVARYIIANPLRAGLVTKIGDYPHWDAVWL